MGGRGAYYKKIGKRHKPKNVKENVFFDDKKFGKRLENTQLTLVWM